MYLRGNVLAQAESGDPMKVDEIGLKILFLLIPGIIALGIMKSIGPKRPRSDFESVLQIFIYGVVCYAITGFFDGLCLWISSAAPRARFWETVGQSAFELATLNPQKALGTDQIAYATGVAIVVGSLVANLQNHSIPHRILGVLSLTNRTNEVDIWDFAVRHHDNGKVYQGWVRSYSSGGDERELLLGDVRVYVVSEHNELVEVDAVPVLYLGLDRKNAVIELRNIT
jgi:hypothetical protein